MLKDFGKGLIVSYNKNQKDDEMTRVTMGRFV
jgi:hypothetical protein